MKLLWMLMVVCTGVVLSVEGSDHQQAMNERTVNMSVDWPTQEWRVSPPQEQNMNPATFAHMQTHIENRLPHLRSVVVIRNGRIVLENYYQGTDHDTKFPMQSMTKSVVSALIGIALQNGSLKNIDQRMADFFPEYATAQTNPRIKDICLKHLLTMTSGLDLSNVSDSMNFIKLAMELPVSHAPGVMFRYSDLDAHLASGILSKATGESALEFADQHLFQLMGIAKPGWMADPQGITIGCSELFLTAREMGKFGYLYVQNGEWDGKQLIPADWVRLSTQKQVEGGYPFFTGYGYFWWVVNIQGHAAYFAGGYGGQYICVIPDVSIVVVITSNADRHHSENFELIGNYILPAIKP